MTKTEILDKIRELPPKEAEEIANTIYNEVLFTTSGLGISSGELSDALKEGESQPAQEMTAEDWDAIRNGNTTFLKAKWGIAL